MESNERAGLKIGDKMPAPAPFNGEIEIIGFRYYTGRHSGRTMLVADWIGADRDGKAIQSFDPVQKLVNLKASLLTKHEAVITAALQDRAARDERVRAMGLELLAAGKDVLKALNGRVHSQPALSALARLGDAIAKAEQS